MLQHLLNDVLIGFRRAYPEITLDIVVSNLRLNLSKRDADVAVRATYSQPETLAGRKVARIAWAVFGPTALALQRFDPAADGQARLDRLYRRRVGRQGDEMAQGPRRRGAHRLQGQHHARAGRSGRRRVGMVVLPCFIGTAIPGLTQLTPTLPELEGELWLLTHPDLRNTARVRAFLDFSAAEIGKRREVIEETADGRLGAQQVEPHSASKTRVNAL